MALGKKTGGRGKNIPNKTTQSARELFVTTLEGQVDSISDAFEKVKKDDPAKFLELFAKYAQYFVPKQMDINLGGKVINVVAPK